MRALRKQEQAAIEAVARHFSATWEMGKGDSPDAYVTVAGKRIAVNVTAIKQRGGALTKPSLRFDRVALAFIGRLQAALRGSVPDGEMVIVTITAPIWLASKTAAAVEDKIRVGLARRSAKLEVKDTIHGNQVRVRLVKGVPRRASKVIGFIHNPDSDPDVLLRLTQLLLRHIGTAAGKRTPKKFTGDRWLVLANEDGLSHTETYRQIHAQLSIPTGFKKIPEGPAFRMVAESVPIIDRIIRWPGADVRRGSSLGMGWIARIEGSVRLRAKD